jgi:electron transport complex protein RnfB
MQDDVYRELARQLDALPNGFPATETGVELRLLAKIFTLEEAGLASVMRPAHEPAADIAGRAGVAPKEALRLLKEMVRKGLVSVRKGDGHLLFGLRPFVVGFYEDQLPRMDEELAALFEHYYQDSRGGIVRDEPSVHRVIPVGEAISFDLEVFPYERASEMLEGAKAWGVSDCICRVQQRLVGKGCDRPVENCLVFAPVDGAFNHREVGRAITREEALQILRESEEAGLVHTTGNYRDGLRYICNCCTCCCGVLRGVAECGIPTAVARSDFRAVVDDASCTGCGDCVASCQFGALSVDDVATVDYVRCVGCGLCAMACPAGALRLERRPAGETSLPPTDLDDWGEQRMQARGLAGSERS